MAIKLCEYGCGQEAKFQLKSGKWICNKNWTRCSINKKKNALGVKKAHKNGKCTSKGLKGKEGWNKGKILNDINTIFTKNSNFDTGYVKKVILQLKLKEYKCLKCDISNWNGTNFRIRSY